MDTQVKEAYIGPQYLSLLEQKRIVSRLHAYAENCPRDEALYFTYGTLISTIPLGINAVHSWYVSFRSYGLVKYGRGRLPTFLLSLTSIVGACGWIDMLGSPSSVTEIFRPENAYYHGFRNALAYQLAYASTTLIPMSISFFWSTRNGVLFVPQKTKFYGVYIDSYREIFTRVRPFRNNMLISWGAGTILMFALGVKSYQQSCELLRAKLNRQTLCMKED